MPKFLSTTVLVSWLVIGNLCQSFETSGEPTRSGRPLKGGEHQPAHDEGQCFFKFYSTKTKRGTITSPDYPKGYRAGIKCVYHLLGRPRERIQLMFKNVDLRQTGSEDVDQLLVVTSVDKNVKKSTQPSTTSPLHVDFLEDFPATHSPRRLLSSDQRVARDRPRSGPLPTGKRRTSEESKLLDQHKYSVLGVYSGRAEPPVFMSAGKHVIITMVTKKTPPDVEEAPAAGFQVDYSFVSNFGITSGEQDPSGECIFRFNSSQLLSSVDRQGTFYSPNHPGLYPRATDCYFLFKRASDEDLVIKFNHLDIDGIPPSCSNESESDFLELWNRIRICTSYPEVGIPAGHREYRFDRHSSPTKAMDHLEEEHHYPGLTLAGEKDGEVIAVRFHSNSIYDAGGFLAEYKFDKSTGPRVTDTTHVAALAMFLLLLEFQFRPGGR